MKLNYGIIVKISCLILIDLHSFGKEMDTNIILYNRNGQTSNKDSLLEKWNIIKIYKNDMRQNKIE